MIIFCDKESAYRSLLNGSNNLLAFWSEVLLDRVLILYCCVSQITYLFLDLLQDFVDRRQLFCIVWKER